jgi:hypothetical protein
MTVQAITTYFDGEEVEPFIQIETYLYKKADADKDPSLIK